MAPIGSRHANTVDEFIQLIARQLPKNGRLRVQNSVSLNDGSEPQPDIATVANRKLVGACFPGDLG
jgi:hypothetical protein